MRKILLLLPLSALLLPLAGALACRGRGSASGAAARATGYHCPMHPDFHSDQPGACKICGMTLVPDAPAAVPAGAGASAGAGAPKTRWRSSMNPAEIYDQPGKDSMGMDLVPFSEAPAAPSSVPGLAQVALDPARRQALGVVTAPAESRPFTRTLRAAGRVTIDETRIAHVHVKTAGYIEHLHADYTGKTVRRGEPLLAIYSPELYATEQEYVAAYRAQKSLAAGGDSAVSEGARALLEAARQRLLLWDVPPGEIRRLESGGAPGRTLTLTSPESGVVTVKNLYHGMQVSPEMDLLQVSDLSRVWVEADLYEEDLPYLRRGARARVTLDYLPGESRLGAVDFVAPQVDAATRTVRIRVPLENRDLKLRPEMLARVELTADLGERLSVPEDALVMTGERTVVFREGEGGALIPVEIVAGAKGDGRVEVKSGLNAGDRVVTRANFLVDSESRLRAALTASGSAAASSPKEQGHDPASH